MHIVQITAQKIVARSLTRSTAVRMMLAKETNVSIAKTIQKSLFSRVSCLAHIFRAIPNMNCPLQQFNLF